jgi:hypothetical protein
MQRHYEELLLLMSDSRDTSSVYEVYKTLLQEWNSHEAYLQSKHDTISQLQDERRQIPMTHEMASQLSNDVLLLHKYSMGLRERQPKERDALDRAYHKLVTPNDLW